MTSTNLDLDDLDRLELLLVGALPPPAVRMAEGTNLLDTEGTPVAEVRAGALVPARSLARGRGPVWRVDLRRSPADVAASLVHRVAPVAVVLDGPATSHELDEARRLALERPVVLVVLASRADQTGAARALRAALADAGPGIDVLVVPWPTAPGVLGAVPELAAVLECYGLPEVIAAEVLRDPGTRAAVGTLERRRDDLVRELYPPGAAAEVLVEASHRRGAVVLLSGLSGSGKSTLARALEERLAAEGETVTLLDGDEVRCLLSSGLGFDRAGRETNLERIGYVAALVARHGGCAIAAPIAPYAESRARIRARAEQVGAFVLVHVSTALEVCEARDRKGLYARARRGEVAEFTGISSPYEVPEDADVVIDTACLSVDDGVAAIMDVLGRLRRS